MQYHYYQLHINFKLKSSNNADKQINKYPVMLFVNHPIKLPVQVSYI